MAITFDKFKEIISPEKLIHILNATVPDELKEGLGVLREASKYNRMITEIWDHSFKNLIRQPGRQIKFTLKNEVLSNVYNLESLTTLCCHALGLKVKHSSTALYKLQTALNDEALTYSSVTDDFKLTHSEIIKQLATDSTELRCSYEVNNPIFYPEIQQKKVVVSERDCNLWKWAQNKEMTDAILVVNDHEFPVHKNILSAISDSFKTLFQGSFNDSKRATLDLFVEKESCTQFLKFLYTGAVDFSQISDHDLFELVDFAHQQLITSFESEAVSEYRRRLTSSSFWATLAVAERLRNDDLKEHCLIFLTVHPNWIKHHLEAETMSIEELLRTIRCGNYLENKELMVLPREALRKQLTTTTFLQIAQEAYDTQNSDLQSICIDFFKELQKTDKEAITSEMKKMNLRLELRFNGEEVV